MIDKLINKIHSTGGLLEDGKTIRSILIDGITEATVSMDYTHHEIHDGTAFGFTIVETLSDGATLIVAFKTPNSLVLPHVFFGWAAKTAAHIELLESPTWTAGSGTQAPLYCRNRNDPKTSILLEDTGGSFEDSGNLVKNPTGFSGGTAIWSNYTWTGRNQETSVDREEQEFILKSNTTYAFRITSDAADNAGWMFMTWYEQINKN